MLTGEEVLGTVSLLLWALVLIVTIKYVLLLLQMDNKGEGGILSLMALARKALGGSHIVFMLGLFGAALFYGDAIITPAISVLSAVEGLKLVTPALDHYVLPITIAIILPLFLVQSRGTARMATFFGPIMLVWFSVLMLAALPHIARTPQVLWALNPWHAVHYLLGHGTGALVALGAVFLAVTGPRRCSPISAISAAGRSRPPGSSSSGRRSPSTISARPPWCCRTPTRPTRSTSSSPNGACCRWCCSPPPPPSSPARR